jgi:hypothetical protein
MQSSVALKITAAVVAIILGILFFVYLPHDPGDLATDALFVGFGLLLLKGTRSPLVNSSPPQKSKSTPQQGKKQKKR